ncbi:MAG: NADH-quinone oxidoreductase subunit J [Pseudomonadota bacterium]|nr:NADH-quinone oxidoreductase subunit J [Pseudomonadota bacterium]|tara:strand:- start:1254 stop:1838 length:585 start_codon:yes stop_codon:yes gene_type:complete
MDIISILFYLVTSVVILSSIALIAVNNTVHAALLLVLIFFNTAILWLMMNAEFLAIVLVLVYVGAVLVLFLFVIMLLDIQVQKTVSKKLYLIFSVVISIIMFAELYMVIFYHDFENTVVENLTPDTSNTYEIGLLLFTEHIFSFEVTAFILLVAIIAAIAINMSDRERALRQDPAKQILETKKSRLKIIKDNEI